MERKAKNENADGPHPLEPMMRAVMEGEDPMGDMVPMVGVVLGEALAVGWPDDLKGEAVSAFDRIVSDVGYEPATLLIFGALAGMALRAAEKAR